MHVGGPDRVHQVPGGGGWQDKRQDGIDAFVGGGQFQAAAERLFGHGGGGVDRAGDRTAARHQCVQPPACLTGQPVDGQAILRAGVRGQHPGAADVGHHRDVPASRNGLAGQQHGDIEQLTEGVGRDDAGLLEQGLPAHQGRHRGCGMRNGGSLTGIGPAGVHREDGHGPADAARGAGELARIAERLDIQDRKLGRVVLLPPHQHVVTRDVVLVPDGSEGRDADAQPGQPVGEGETETAGLHDQAGNSWGGMPGGEGGVQPDAGHGDAETVRADQPHAVAAADGQQVRALRGVKPRGDDDQGPHAAPAAFVGHARYGGRWHGDDREIDGFGKRGDRGQTGHRLHVRGVRVDRVNPSLVAAGDDVVQEGAAELFPSGGWHR